MQTERRSLRSCARIALTLSAIAAGCHSGPVPAGSGLSISAHLPLASYVQSRIVAGNGRKAFFPQLLIYNVRGKQVYVSHNAAENAQALKSLSARLESLQPVPNAPDLADIVDSMPDFHAKRSELLNRHQATVVSIFLEECDACSLQEEALDVTQRQLLDRGVNLLIVRVARPANS